MRDTGDPPHDDWDPVQLAQQMAAQRRLDAEEDERLAALAELRARTLPEVAAALWARRMLVEIGVGGQRFRGRIAAVGRDWLALATHSGEIDVRLHDGVWLRELSDRTPEPRPPDQDHPRAAARTFDARLAQLELAGGVLDLGVATGMAAAGPELSGRITAAARDHVVVRDVDGGTWHLSGVAWVRLHGS